MAYEINNTFGTKIVSLADGTLDTTTTDLALFGKGYAGFVFLSLIDLDFPLKIYFD